MKIRSIGREALALSLVGFVVAGCTAPLPGEEVGALEQAVELHDLNDVYRFSFVPPEPLAPGEPLAALRDRLERQTFPIHSSGSVHVPLVDASFAPVSRFGVPVRFTCGATLVSPSYVITAAHCVDSESVRGGSSDVVTLEMYRPTPRLGDPTVWQPRTVLSGTFPNYERVPFGEPEGYFVDRYTCQLESRCGFGSFDCPSPVIANGDVAVLRCDGRPGDRYGYVDVASTDVPGVEVLVPWKHEVYDVPPTEPVSADRYAHYVRYPPVPEYWQNYHYLGGDKNQLLPLHSVNWPNGTPRRKLGDVSGLVVWTDALGCHGTSGSGFLQRDPSSGAWQLLGPTAAGLGNFANFLCEHNPGVIGQSTVVPGQLSLGYSSLAQTQTILAPERAAIGRDCLAPRPGHFVLPSRTSCERDNSGLTFAGRTTFVDLDPWRAPSARLLSGAAALGSVELSAGRSYRLSVGAVANASCSTTPGAPSCPELAVRAGSRELLRGTIVTAAQTNVFGALFVADASGDTGLSIAVQGASFELGEVSLIENGRANTFDSGVERAEAGLMVPGVDAAAVLPMRFVGDGAQGFAALLERGERLLLTRQAVALRGRYSVRFDATAGASVRCGFVGRSASVLATVPCVAGANNLIEYNGGELPSAVFFESTLPTGRVQLDNVRVELLDPASTSHCTDGVRSGNESAVDCGGSCPRCATGQACVAANDCVSALCQAGVCTAPPAPRCDDRVRNGTETDVDCGGPACGDCATGRACVAANDCVSALCQAGVCTAPPAPRCDDRVRNGTETDVDCGGPACGDCATGRACVAANDCVSALCQAGVCTAPPAAGVSASVAINSEWTAGYCANVTVTNRSATAINGWTVVFDVQQSAVQSLWSAQFTNTGSVYTARPFSWNSQLQPSQSTSFGFCANKTGANFRPTVTRATSP